MTRTVAVVGAGLSGAAAAWRLADAGHDVTLIERSHPANDLGSSHGSARIFRYAYEDEQYVRMVVEAEKGWRELEALAAETLISDAGAVDFGEIRQPTHLADILARVGVEHSVYTAQEARERWSINFDTEVLWQPGAGVIDADHSVTAMVAAAQRHGARVLVDNPVTRIERSGSGYLVVSDTGESVEVEQVVVAAGGWLPVLLERLALPSEFLARMPALQVRQEQALHFPYGEGETNWPTFIYKSPEIQTYGLPGGRDANFAGQKMAEFNGGKIIPSAEAHDKIIDPVNRERVTDFARTFMPGLIPEPYAETTCLFTNTPDENFIIDRVEGITVLSPCSGHGAKFAPLIGEYAVDLVTGRADVPTEFRPSLVGAAV